MMTPRGLAALCLMVVTLRGTQAAAHPMTVEVFKGDFATVNSFIFSNGRSLVVLDVQRKAREAKQLVQRVKLKHLPLTHILISHGHTDHFTGMDIFHKEFPHARIVVANEAIRRDIKNYAIYMDSGGETGAEPALDPALKPKSAKNPGGFDYERTIQVLSGNTLEMQGGGTLELTTAYPAAEAPHMTTVYSKDLNALFLSDFGYNKVHLWMGDDTSLARVAAWKAELARIKALYSARNPTVYPGHGDPSDMTLFDTLIKYIDDYTRIVSEATSRKEAMQRMKTLYPDYQQADFFLKYSIENHVR